MTFGLSSVSLWVSAWGPKTPVITLCINKSAQVFARSVVSVNFSHILKETSFLGNSTVLFNSIRKKMKHIEKYKKLSKIKVLFLVIGSKKEIKHSFIFQMRIFFLDERNMQCFYDFYIWYMCKMCCNYTAASLPFPVNCLLSSHLCHYSEFSWDLLLLILIHCYCHKGRVEAQQHYTTDSSIAWFAQADVPKRI